jgi:hypothetical protein
MLSSPTCNLWTTYFDFHGIWFEYYAIRSHTKLVCLFFFFLISYIPY